jgi:hypothetical protein
MSISNLKMTAPEHKINITLTPLPWHQIPFIPLVARQHHPVKEERGWVNREEK